jgi:hypothetical protein
MKTINELTQDISKMIEQVNELAESEGCQGVKDLLENAECDLQKAIDTLNDAHEAAEAEKSKAH